MKDYKVLEDILTVQGLLEYTDDDMANSLGVTRTTLNNWKKKINNISDKHTEQFYEFAFNNGINLNKIKESLHKEEINDKNHKVLFHGAKTDIKGKISLEKSKDNNDFGKGFYCGESLEQSAMFVSIIPKSSLYIVDFNKMGLKGKNIDISEEWILLIAYHRGRLEEWSHSKKIKNILNKYKDLDYIIAPIADNRVYEIIDSFINGEITNIQCQHSLAATDLGKQYVFLSERAIKNLKVLEHCYLAEREKDYYLAIRSSSINMNRDKVKIARRKYRNEGKYIEEILK